MVKVVLDRIEVISIISLKRLIEGGAAMLVAERINHHIAIRGKMFNRPFVMKSLRVEVAS